MTVERWQEGDFGGNETVLYLDCNASYMTYMCDKMTQTLIMSVPGLDFMQYHVKYNCWGNWSKRTQDPSVQSLQPPVNL